MMEREAVGSQVSFRITWTWLAGVFVFYWLLVVVLQHVSNAPQAGFGRHSDEPAHYVSGLMVRDYIAAGFPESPVRFAAKYYLHRPTVAIGYWPPAFYVLEGAWMLIFGNSRSSVLVLMALISAALQLIICYTAASQYGLWTGFVAGSLFAFLPVVQWSNGMVMTDIAVALPAFAATLFCLRYFQYERTADAAWFGLFIALSMLTKSSAAFLLTLPFASMLIYRRFRLLRAPSMWLPIGIVALLYGPWFIFTRHLAGKGLLQVNIAEHFVRSFPLIVRQLYGIAGPLLLALTLIGILAVFSKAATPAWAVLAVQFVIGIAFLALAPVNPEARYLTLVLPSMVLLACAGLHAILQRTRFKRSQSSTAAAVAAAAVLIMLVVHKPSLVRINDAASEAAAAVLDHPEAQNSVVLVTSNGMELRMVAELASKASDWRNQMIFRSNKLLARVGWNGEDYTQRTTTLDGVIRTLDDVPVSFVLADVSPGLIPRPHHRILVAALEANPRRWQVAGNFSVPGSNRGWRLYYSPGRSSEPKRIPEALLNDVVKKVGGSVEW